MGWDTDKPGDNDFISQYPQNERQQRAFVKDQAFARDHMQGDDADLGKHKQATIKMRDTEPLPVDSDEGLLFVLEVDDVGELMYMDSDGVITQLTKDGSLNENETFLRMIAVDVPPEPPEDGGAFFVMFVDYGGGIERAEAFYIDDQEEVTQITRLGTVAENLNYKILLAQDTAPAAIAGLGTIFTAVFDGHVELYYRDSTGLIARLTSKGALNVASPAVVRLPKQETAPTFEAEVGYVYTQEVEGVTELFYMDSDGEAIQLTRAGNFNLDFPESAVTFASVRTESFFRGRVANVSSVDGLLVLDWETATTFRVTITETTLVQFVNMPDFANRDEEQLIYVDITNGGNFDIIIGSPYDIVWPNKEPIPFTENGRDWLLAACCDGESILLVPILDVGEDPGA